MRGPSSWLLIALATGCNGINCPTAEEVEFRDNTEAGDAALVEFARDALHTFFVQTGRERICVDEVRVEDQVGRESRGVAGRYNPRPIGKNLLITRGTNPLLDKATIRHELCHALDYTEGVRQSHGDALMSDVYPNVKDYYPRPWWRPETYAYNCMWGPRPPVDQIIEEHCDDLEPVGTPAQRVDEQITWRGAFPPAESRPLEVTWSTLPLDGSVLRALRAGRSVVLVQQPAWNGLVIRWLDELDGTGDSVASDLRLAQYEVWPGEDRVLMVPLPPERTAWLVDRAGNHVPVDLGGRAWGGRGALHGDHALGPLVNAEGEVELSRIDLTSDLVEVETSVPIHEYIEPTAEGVAIVSPEAWVVQGPPTGPFEHVHHAVTYAGVDLPGGRLFRVFTTREDGTEMALLFAAAPEGVMHFAGCNDNPGFAARLGNEGVLIGIDDGLELRLGHVTGL